MVHHIEADITTYLADLAPKFHPSFNSVAAAALLGVARPLLAALRGADMARQGKLHASIMTSDRLEATPGFRVGTSDHLETFGSHGLPGYSHLQGLALGENTGRDLWYDLLFPQYDSHEVKTAPDAPLIVEAFSSCLTGMVPGGHFGPLEDIPPLVHGWASWDLNSSTTHKLTWVFPPVISASMRIPHPNITLVDFSKMKERDLSFMLSVWDKVLETVAHPLAAPALNGLSAAFSPTVKDLIRWGAMSHPGGPSKKVLYQHIWRSKSMADRDRFFNRGRPLPIDEALGEIVMDPHAASPASLANED